MDASVGLGLIAHLLESLHLNQGLWVHPRDASVSPEVVDEVPAYAAKSSSPASLSSTGPLRTYCQLEVLHTSSLACGLTAPPFSTAFETARHSSTDYLVEVTQLALTSQAPVDRTYWRHRALQALSAMPAALRQDLGRRCARSVAVTHSIPHRERDAFVAELAKVVVPLAA